MSSDELLDAVLALSVQVLELMHGRELLHIQPIWSNNVCVRKKSRWREEGNRKKLCERKRENGQLEIQYK